MYNQILDQNQESKKNEIMLIKLGQLNRFMKNNWPVHKKEDLQEVVFELNQKISSDLAKFFTV